MAAADDPLIRALFNRLPPLESHWRPESRVVWLNTMAYAFSLLYMPSDAPQVEATIVPAPTSQNG